MKWPILFLAPILLLASDDPELSPDNRNVNKRYTIESVHLANSAFKQISKPLRSDIDSLVGQKFDPTVVTELARRIRTEIHKRVTHRIEKADTPEQIRLIYETSDNPIEDDPDVTKIRYHQKYGWTAGLGADFNVGPARLEAGIQTDADELLERYAGVNAGVSVPAGDRVRAHFHFEAFHQQWNNTTIEALAARPDIPGIYRERFNMEPGVTFIIADGLTLTGNISIQHFQTQFPAARFEAANAVETTLRYHTRWRESDSFGQELDAGYTLRAATNMLGTDYVYTRHSVDARYAIRRDEHLFTLGALAGWLNGEAPLFDRFSLGNSRTLRGWNKFDIDPLGGDRLVHGSVGYRYRAIGFFYDVGSVWEHGKEPQDRHSVGVTLAMGALRDGPYLTLAFPLRNGAIQPLFMLGMNF